MGCGPRPTDICMAATFCPRRASSPNRSRWKRSASTARCFTAEPDPETNFKLFGPVARAGTDVKAEQPRLRAAAAAESGFCRRRWRRSAGSTEFCARGFTAASARTIGAHFTDGRTVVPFATELAIKAGSDRARRRRHAAGGARCRAGRLSRRHRRGPADARRQSGADDDGAGARGGVSFRKRGRVGKGALAPCPPSLSK